MDRHEKTYVDVKVFNPHAPCNRASSARTIYRKHELCKKRSYEARIREVEKSSFTPLIFSAAWLLYYLTSGTQIMQL